MAWDVEVDHTAPVDHLYRTLGPNIIFMERNYIGTSTGGLQIQILVHPEMNDRLRVDF